MPSSETASAIAPLLRHRLLRILVVAAPAITSTVAILTAEESNLAVAVALNVAAGIIISTAIFVAVSMVARRVADDRVSLAQAAGDGTWRARAERLSIYHADTGLYADWYLRLRLLEEIDRARRYDIQFTVLVATPVGLHQDDEIPAASAWSASRFRRFLRGSDLAAVLRDGTLAVVFPHTKREGALQRRLIKALSNENARVGLACFPGDGEDANELLSAAAQAATAAHDIVHVEPASEAALPA